MKKTIYYVENDELSQVLMSAFLDKNFSDYEIKVFDLVSIGKKYMDINGFPSIVISDYKMPEGEDDGESLIRWMVKKGFDKYIAWTGNSEDLIEKLPNFKFDCINKNDFNKLLTVMNRVLLSNVK